MLQNKLIIFFLVWAFSSHAHEMTPAYPIVKPSHVTGVVKVDLSLFNSREEIKYYEIGLFDLIMYYHFDISWKKVCPVSPHFQRIPLIAKA